MNNTRANTLNPMPEVEYRQMAELESSLWWYRCLHHHLLQSFAEHTVPHTATILDLGCGTGGSLAALTQSGYVNACGVDISSTALRICKERGLRVDFGDIGALAHIATASIDVIISFDVLIMLSPEHYSLILGQIHRILRRDGLLILNLPARDLFSGAHDQAVGIVRRIVVDEFCTRLRESNFNLEKTFAWPFILSPLILVIRSFQRLKMTLRPSPLIRSDVQAIPPVLNTIFEFISRIETKIPSVIRRFGSSQFFICKKID